MDVFDAVTTVTVQGPATAAPTPPSGCGVTEVSGTEFLWTCLLPPLDSVTPEIVLDLPFTVDGSGTVAVSGAVSSSVPDPDPTNNSETESTTVN